MNAPKYTPGPWSFRDGFALAVGPVADPEGDAIAHIVGHPSEAFDNARLIASAPELLETLRTILEVWDSHKIIGPTVYHDARAIVAKAEGSAV